MSADLKFVGRLTYQDSDAVADAVAEAVFVVDDDDLSELLDEDGCIDVGANHIEVNIDFSGPASWFLLLDDLMETFAEHASGGKINCWHEGEQMDAYEPE